MSETRAPPAHPVLALQRAIGNVATARLLARMTDEEYDGLRGQEREQVQAAIDFALRVGFPGGGSEKDRQGVLDFIKLKYDVAAVKRIGQLFSGYAAAQQQHGVPGANEVDQLRLEAEIVLRDSPLTPGWVKARLGQGHHSAIRNRVRVLGVCEFAEVYATAGERASRSTFDPLSKAVAAWESIAGTDAATGRPETGGVVMRAGMADLHNAVHEILHALSGYGWIKNEWPPEDTSDAARRDVIIEGATEHLTVAIAGGGGY